MRLARAIGHIAVAAVVCAFITACESVVMNERDPDEASPAEVVDERSRIADEINPDLIRYVEPDGWGLAQVQCLDDAGFPGAHASSDGGVSYPEMPAEQASAFSSAQDLCTRQYPVDPRFRAPFTQSQLTALHAYYEEVLVPCLEREGHLIGNVPSLQPFVENYFTSGWSPYSFVAVTDDGVWMQLQETCPQWPGDLFNPTSTD
ncbi:hypothetical protein [Microcella alkaliphila]|uniref:hypothetical protein n=1 Tax=Microcella alkaliphila TaxID=279828 RepID=UPI001028E6E5|nr:hypothetical protein [Microcella alkaliphila]